MSHEHPAANEGSYEERVQDEEKLAALQQQLNALQAEIG